MRFTSVIFSSSYPPPNTCTHTHAHTHTRSRTCTHMRAYVPPVTRKQSRTHLRPCIGLVFISAACYGIRRSFDISVEKFLSWSAVWHCCLYTEQKSGPRINVIIYSFAVKKNCLFYFSLLLNSTLLTNFDEFPTGTDAEARLESLAARWVRPK